MKASINNTSYVSLFLCLTFSFQSAECFQIPWLTDNLQMSTRTKNPPAKDEFIGSLNVLDSLNEATQEKNQLLNEMIDQNPTEEPASMESIRKFAAGSWRIVYAPHISTMGKLAQGSFNPVIYDLSPPSEESKNIIISHARYDFPWMAPFIKPKGWLSVSGTYGSQDNESVCRVDFDKAWITFGEEPVNSFDDVDNTWYKDIIKTLGNLAFIDQVAVFPVSYLDNDTIVFDFELLGTRICAKKI